MNYSKVLNSYGADMGVRRRMSLTPSHTLFSSVPRLLPALVLVCPLRTNYLSQFPWLEEKTMPTQPTPLQDQSWLLSSGLSPPPGLREALGPTPLTAWTSSESTVRSYGSMCRLSNTCRRVIFRPRFSATVLSGSVWYVCLMKRSRCFWFMQAAAWMCVSTCDTVPQHVSRSTSLSIKNQDPRASVLSAEPQQLPWC